MSELLMSLLKLTSASAAIPGRVSGAETTLLRPVVTIIFTRPPIMGRAGLDLPPTFKPTDRRAAGNRLTSGATATVGCPVTFGYSQGLKAPILHSHQAVQVYSKSALVLPVCYPQQQQWPSAGPTLFRTAYRVMQSMPCI
jgi:hypothetical protein